MKTDQSKSDQSTQRAQPSDFKCTVFLDRTHGKALYTLMRKVGFNVKSIFKLYPNRKHETTSDPTWIRRCGAEGWVAISGDKRIETNIENKKAVIDAKAKVFILSDTNSLAEEWAAAVICGKDKFYNLARKNEGPFFVTIGRQAQTHVSDIRFPKLEPEKPSGEQKEPKPSPSEVQGSSGGHPTGQAANEGKAESESAEAER